MRLTILRGPVSTVFRRAGELAASKFLHADKDTPSTRS